MCGGIGTFRQGFYGDCINKACTTGKRGWKTIGREDSWEEQHGEATKERTEEHGRLVV